MTSVIKRHLTMYIFKRIGIYADPIFFYRICRYTEQVHPAAICYRRHRTYYALYTNNIGRVFVNSRHSLKVLCHKLPPSQHYKVGKHR